MKTVRYVGDVEDWKNHPHGAKVIRVDDETAKSLTSTGNWKYVPKSEYKQRG